MISNKLVELRLAKGWTQAELAEKTKIPRTMISRYEHDTIPRGKNLKTILAAFDLTPNYFIDLAKGTKEEDGIDHMIARKKFANVFKLPDSDLKQLLDFIDVLMDRQALKDKMEKIKKDLEQVSF